MLTLLTSISFFLIPIEIDFRAIPKCEQYNPRLADEGCPKGGGGGIVIDKGRIEFRTTKDGRTGFVKDGKPVGVGSCKGGGGGNCGNGKGGGGGNGTGNEGRGKGPIK